MGSEELLIGTAIFSLMMMYEVSASGAVRRYLQGTIYLQQKSGLPSSRDVTTEKSTERNL